MKKKLMFLLLIIVMISILGVLCTRLFSEKVSEPKEKINIVTSFYPIYIVAKNITEGVEGVGLTNMAENHTGCLHDYQLSTNDMRELEKADIFLINGVGMEPFVDDIIQAYPDLLVIDTSTGTTFIDEGEPNGHIWLNLENYKIQVENIKKALAEFDAPDARAYEANARKYEEQIEKLADEEQEVEQLIGNKNIIIFHEGLEYLAQDLGLNVVHSLDLDEEVSLSAKEIAEIIEKINTHGVKSVFVQEEQKHLIQSSIESETNAVVYTLDPLVSGEDVSNSYIEGMEKNLELIRMIK